MAKKQYISIINNRTPRPRSRRLRELGAASEGGSSVVITTTDSSTGTGDGPTHDHKRALDALPVDADRSVRIAKTQ